MMKKILSLIHNKSIEDKSLSFIKERVVRKLPKSIHRYSAINDHLKSSLKDSYDRANKFKHSKPLTGGPEGRTE